MIRQHIMEQLPVSLLIAVKLLKGSVFIRKEFNSHRTGLGHRHGRRFIVLGHQYGRRDAMWKHSIDCLQPLLPLRKKIGKGQGGGCRQAKLFMVWFGFFAAGVKGGGVTYENDEDSRLLS